MIMQKDGFEFEFNPDKCSDCGGKCCTGDSGYIWISKDEIAKLASHFNMDFKECCEKFLYKEGFSYSIKEKPYDDGYACLFFDEKNKNCLIYELRPKQCRTFPFWDYFKKHYDELEKECIGVRRLV